MSSDAGPRLRPAVLAARERLAEGREKLRQRHTAGSPGIQLCARLTDLVDSVVLDLYEAALADTDPGLEAEIAIVPHGGYGRRDLAPYSDVDLMLLHRPGTSEQIAPLARCLSQYIVDAGLQLGFTARTPEQATSMALRDATIFTSLAESRYLGGSVRLFTKFMNRLRRQAMRKSRMLVGAIEQARVEERNKYGETVYLLQPNVKRSLGALRDIQLVRWVGFARYGEVELDDLQLAGILSNDDRVVLRNAREFLLRLRNELHFHAGKSQDVLGRDEQLRLAELYGLQGDEALLPVERFMRLYFDHVSQVRYAVFHFVNIARDRTGALTRAASLFSHQVEGDFRVGPMHIGATRRGLEKMRGNLAEVLRLMDLANLYNKRIAHNTWIAIRNDMIGCEQLDLSDEAVHRFLSLLSQPPRLANLLRRLHEMRVLEKIIPAVNHARGLLQFNQYHKYTVDEHTLQAVERATEFMDDPDILGEVYRGIEQKRTLHLALLLHDLGKGHPEDHSEVGLQIAREVALRFKLSPHESKTLQFLVHKHLQMAHLALWHNINDASMVVRFAADVETPEVLQMLFVLTCADIAAVGPGVLNPWKLQLLTELYYRTLGHFRDAPQHSRARDSRPSHHAQLAASESTAERTWVEQQLNGLPSEMLSEDDGGQLVSQLGRLYRERPAVQAVTWARYVEDRNAALYVVAGHEKLIRARFHRLTGMLTSRRNQILSAEFHALQDECLMVRFFASDSDYADEPPESRTAEIIAALEQALVSSDEVEPTFREVWSNPSESLAPVPQTQPTRIGWDNNSSDQFTILTIFAYDRMGLLYSITRQLSEASVTIHSAKIATYLDQVVDVFYVTDARGAKIGEEQAESIRERLRQAVDPAAVNSAS